MRGMGGGETYPHHARCSVHDGAPYTGRLHVKVAVTVHRIGLLTNQNRGDVNGCLCAENVARPIRNWCHRCALGKQYIKSALRRTC